MPYSFEDAVDTIMSRHPEYAREAYEFMRRALDESVRRFEKGPQDPHLSAEELYIGFCAYALDEFGPLAAAVIEHWGINSSSDVGAIVYNLIEVGIFGRQEGDHISQFDDLCPIQVLLDAPYEADFAISDNENTQN